MGWQALLRLALEIVGQEIAKEILKWLEEQQKQDNSKAPSEPHVPVHKEGEGP